MIAAVICGKESRGVRRVSHGRVEIDDTVICAAGPDEAVDGFAHNLSWGSSFIGRRVVSGSSEWRQSSADYLEPPIVRASDQLAVACNDFIGGNGSGRRLRQPDVVGTQQDDDVFDSGLVEHVALESRQAGWPGDFVQKSVAGNAFIDDGEVDARAGEPVG